MEKKFFGKMKGWKIYFTTNQETIREEGPSMPENFWQGFRSEEFWKFFWNFTLKEFFTENLNFGLLLELILLVGWNTFGLQLIFFLTQFLTIWPLELRKIDFIGSLALVTFNLNWQREQKSRILLSNFLWNLFFGLAGWAVIGFELTGFFQQFFNFHEFFDFLPFCNLNKIFF